MAQPMNICLLNDSFPPVVDGVATCVMNYASVIERKLGHALVCTPYYPNTVDDYAFPVIRYPSLSVGKNSQFVYRAGMPFSAKLMDRLRSETIDVIHTHCPIMSAMLARTLREQINKPIIMTYHTKFNIEIEKLISLKSMQKTAMRLLSANVAACDEVWVVSEGAGQNLRSLGYEGEYYLMENGVDFLKGRSAAAFIALINEAHDLTPDEPVFLFVGRMMWYKGIKTILDGLNIAKAKGSRFKMLFVGDGEDKQEIVEYAKRIGLNNECIFIHAVHDRAKLRAYYSRADLFLFPSDFDTNGIVVREAAACGTPSLMLAGSCAAEGITDNQNGILIQSSARELADRVMQVCIKPGFAREIGERAMNEIYLSWDDAVTRAYERYQIVAEKYAKSAHSERPIHKGDDFFRFMSYVCRNTKHKKPLKRRLYKPKKHKVFKAKNHTRWL